MGGRQFWRGRVLSLEDTMVLDDSQNDHFIDSLNSVANMFLKKEIAVIARDFSRHVGSSAKDYDDQHGGQSFGVGIMKVKRLWSFVFKYDSR